VQESEAEICDVAALVPVESVVNCEYALVDIILSFFLKVICRFVSLVLDFESVEGVVDWQLALVNY